MFQIVRIYVNINLVQVNKVRSDIELEVLHEWVINKSKHGCRHKRTPARISSAPLKANFLLSIQRTWGRTCSFRPFEASRMHLIVQRPYTKRLSSCIIHDCARPRNVFDDWLRDNGKKRLARWRVASGMRGRKASRVNRAKKVRPADRRRVCMRNKFNLKSCIGFDPRTWTYLLALLTRHYYRDPYFTSAKGLARNPPWFIFIRRNQKSDLSPTYTCMHKTWKYRPDYFQQSG